MGLPWTVFQVSCVFKLLDAPSMRSKKIIPLTVKKGTKVKLRCEADGNPQPTFTWHENSDLVSSGFNSSWHVSILIVEHTAYKDFARFVCTAKNRVGWDALTFSLQYLKGTFWNLSSRSVESDNLSVALVGGVKVNK